MERFWRIAKWTLLLLLIYGCGRSGPNGPDIEPVRSPESRQLYASAEKPSNLALAVSDSAKANARLIFRDLRGREFPAGEVEVLAYMGPTLIDQARGNALTIFLSLPGNVADFDGDGDVDFDDFFLFAEHWPSNQGYVFTPRYDLDGDGDMGFQDFFIFGDLFGWNRVSRLAKPIVPDWIYNQTIGNLSADLTEQFRSYLLSGQRRAAKIAAGEVQHHLVVRSLEQKFAPLDTIVVGDFVQLRDIVLRVNTPPRPAVIPGVPDTLVIGDTLRVVMSRFFDSDDVLKFTIERTVLAWSVERDSVLLVMPASAGTTGITFRATDTAGQSWAFELIIVAKERPLPPPPPDTQAPVATVTFNADTTAVNYSAVDDSLVTTVATLDGKVVYSDTLSSASIALALSDGYHQLSFVFTDKSGNTTKSEHRLVKPDRTAPAMALHNVEWVGAEKRQMNFDAVFADSLSGVAGWGVWIIINDKIVFDQSGAAGGRNNITYSFDFTFPAVSEVTRRVIKMRAGDGLKNFRQVDITVDQPISPYVPPPPPPPPTQPPPSQPPPNVAPTISATVNGQTGTIQVTAGTALTFSATATGTPTPTITWTFAGQTVQSGWAAVSGTMTVTATNSAGSASQTFNISALGGAP